MSLVSVIETLKEYFGWTDEDVKRKEFNLSFLYYLKKEDIIKKADFYKITFNLTQAEFIKMLKTLPALLGYNNESVLDKKKNFDKIGLNKNDIIKNPSILAAPSNSLIFKYILLYIDFGNKSFLEKNWYMTSEKKTWARYTFIKQNGRVKPADVLIGEKIFQKRYGVESCALMEKFPITKEVVEFVNSEYNKLAEKNGDKKLEIKFEDLQKKDKEKGE